MTRGRSALTQDRQGDGRRLQVVTTDMQEESVSGFERHVADK